MQKLLDEINQVKNDVEVYLNTQKETSDGNQTEIRNFNENINDLRTRMDAMARGSDSNWPMETFDQVKRDALDTLSNLSKRLHEFNQHFEETVDAPVSKANREKSIRGCRSKTKNAKDLKDVSEVKSI
ncbi:unnamed protein product [Adineta ricciae]|uniref:Uncharacterized protein n=1 Tax=Adineta ricciae TaxID=249248 RepID=A0A814K3S9_ADIRI|nr:unnamed protein product [Adineta ricciae]